MLDAGSSYTEHQAELVGNLTNEVLLSYDVQFVYRLNLHIIESYFLTNNLSLMNNDVFVVNLWSK